MFLLKEVSNNLLNQWILFSYLGKIKETLNIFYLIPITKPTSPPLAPPPIPGFHFWKIWGSNCDLDIWFDVTRCKFFVRSTNLNVSRLFAFYFCGRHKVTFVYNFVPPVAFIHQCIQSNSSKNKFAFKWVCKITLNHMAW